MYSTSPLTNPSLIHSHKHAHIDKCTHAHTHIPHVDTYMCTHVYIHMCMCMHKRMQVDPAQLLSLHQFVCRSVSVSFVVVNKNGASTESPTATIAVAGKGTCTHVLKYLQPNPHSRVTEATNYSEGVN